MKEQQKPKPEKNSDLEKRIELLERIVLSGEVDARHELKKLMVERRKD